MSPHTDSDWTVPAPSFPTELRARMEARGLSVRRLADLSNLNSSTINLWRGGNQKRYRVENVAKVAPHLGSSVEALLDLPDLEEKERTNEPIPLAELDLLRRLASLRPRLEQLVPELEELVEEAGRASETSYPSR